MWGNWIKQAGSLATNLFGKKNKEQGLTTNTVGQTSTKQNQGVNTNDSLTNFFDSDAFKNGIAGVSQSGMDMMSAQSSSLPKSVKQMQTGDSAVNMAADAVGMIPGWGTAVGMGMKLVNSIGGSLVSTPMEYKTFNTNQEVAQSSSLGGVQANAAEAQSVIDGYASSGLVGKLIGKRRKNRDKVTKANDQQVLGQEVLTQSKNAFDQQASADIFRNRNTMSLMGYNNQVQFGKKGVKLDRKNLIEIKHIVKAQKGSKMPIVSQGLRILNQDERKYWNGFSDYVGNQGFLESDEMNTKDKGLSRALWDDYKALSGTNYEYDEFIPAAQYTMKRYRDYGINKLKNGFGKFGGYTLEDLSSADFDWDNLYLPGISKVDGWAGTKTVGFQFPGGKRNEETQPDAQEESTSDHPGEQTGINKNQPDIEPEIEEGEDDGEGGEKKSKSKETKSFKEGGIIEDADNVIVDGALHARKHNLNELEHLKDAEITTKGVPVVSMEDGGEITQHAEVEFQEIIFNLETTKKLEELMKLGTDEAKIEAGKLLTFEILQNTKDKTGLIDSIK